MNHSEELGLATALASTTDKGRAEILANMEGGKAQKAEKPTEPKEAKPTNSVKKELAVRGDLTTLDQAWGKVQEAVSAAQSACRKYKESEPDEDPQDSFRKYLDELVAVLQGMKPKDIFKEMASEANKTRV